MQNSYDIFRTEQDAKSNRNNQASADISTGPGFKKADSYQYDQNLSSQSKLGGVLLDMKPKKDISPFEKQPTSKDREVIDKGGNLLFGTIASKFPGFDKIQLPKYDVNFLGSNLSAVNLLVRYVVDFFLIIPWFILYNLYEGGVVIYSLIQRQEYKKSVIYFFLYAMDSLLPMSYIFLFFIMISISSEIMYNWIASCFILFCSFLLLVVYYSLVSEPFEGWKSFFTFSHLDTLGLGMCRRTYEDRIGAKELKTSRSFAARASIHKKLAAKTNDYAEFQKSIRTIFDSLTIDDTFFYYSYFSDDLNKENSALISDPDTNELFAKEMIYVQHKGSHLLFRMNENSMAIADKQQEIKISDVLVFMLLILFKIVVPYIFMFEDLNETEIDNFSVFSITLFYIFIIAVLFPLVSHEDLKRRTYILESLNRLILFQKDLTLDEEEIADYDGSSPGRKTKQDTLNQLKSSGIEHVTSELQLKIDVTCVISLETWDCCRRAAVLMDQKRSEKFETTYIFLGVYAFFVIFVLLQVLFDVYLFFSSTSPLNSPLIVVIFTIDFVIMLVLFFQRIYYGSSFNDTFKKQRDSLEKLTAIFQDFIDMFDLYYESRTRTPINNLIYRAIFDRILKKYETVSYKYASSGRTEDGKAFLKNYLKKLAETVNRIKNQLIYDESHFNHRFLGILSSDFQLILAEVCIVLIPVLPTLFSSIVGSN